jgi:trans-2,3-dihydro-3-hydroxyanthranilate isomerase
MHRATSLNEKISRPTRGDRRTNAIYDHTMKRLEYLQLDVFTNRRFEGNQLAVFPDGRGLDPALMQTIAREMNFSETTFILPPERPETDVRMRIFTPGVELPMAGHPTIGSTFALAHLGVIAAERDHFVFGLGVGPTRVELTWKDGALSFAWMDQRPPEYRVPAVSTEHIVRAVGIDPDACSKTKLPAEEISCGIPYMMLPVATRAAVDAAQPDMTALRALRSAFPNDHIGVLVFTTEPTEPGVTAYSRMFGPGLGVPEDPATGSAAGPLGCYLVKHGLVKDADAAKKIVNWQGVAMGRPSRLHIAITSDGGDAITRVQVGGQSVLVAEGTLTA